MTNPTETKARLDHLWSTYTTAIEALANEIFEGEVKPLCDKHNYGFGFTKLAKFWHIYHLGSLVPVMDQYGCTEDDLKPLQELLSLKVGGLYIALGSLMPEYVPEQEQSNEQP